MTKHTFAALFALIVNLSPSLAADRPTMGLPRVGMTVEAFVPAGYEIAVQARSDFNRDGRTDVAFITWVERESDDPRALIILFQQPDAAYRLSAVTAKFPPSIGGGCGSRNIYCVPDLRARGDRLSVSWAGGSGTSGWTDEYHFRFIKGDWFLVGKSESTWSTDPCENEVRLGLRKHERCARQWTHSNFLTGAISEQWLIHDVQTGRERTKRAHKGQGSLRVQRLTELETE